VNTFIMAASHMMDKCIVTFNNISFCSNHLWLRNSHRKQNYMFYYVLDAQPFLVSTFLPHREQSNSSINGNKTRLTPRVSRCPWLDSFRLIFLISYEGIRVIILDNATIPVFSLHFMMNYWCHKYIHLLLFCYHTAKISDFIRGSSSSSSFYVCHGVRPLVDPVSRI
jgi:hypothetical protein